MPRINGWIMVGVGIIAGLHLAACTPLPVTGGQIPPARVEPIEGTGLNRVVLSAKAAERLGIETAAVSETRVERQRTVGGEVVALPEGSGADTRRVWVRALLTASDLDQVDRHQPALILPLGREGQEDDAEESDLTAEPDDGSFADPEVTGGALHYAVGSASHGLVPGQIVLVRVPLLGSGDLRKVVSYSAVLYDLDGTTWVYTNPESLVFVRHVVTIDYIEGEQVVLSEGPPTGTPVVIAGVAELFGAETGVGK